MQGWGLRPDLCRVYVLGRTYTQGRGLRPALAGVYVLSSAIFFGI